MKWNNTLFFLIAFSCFTACELDIKERALRKSDIEVIWEKDYEKEFYDKYFPFKKIILHDNNFFVFTGGKYSPIDVLLKFDKQGNYISKWDESSTIGAKHIYDHKLYTVERESSLVAIDLNTMTTAWRLEFDKISTIYQSLDNKIYVIAFGDNGNQLLEINLDNQQYRVIYEVDMQNQGAFSSIEGTHYPYINDNGDTAIIITEKVSIDDSLKLINFNITKGELNFKIVLEDLYDDAIRKGKLKVINDRIYGSGFNSITCRNLSNGEKIWTKKLRTASNNAYSPEAFFTEEKTFYTFNNRLYCIDSRSESNIWSKGEDDYDRTLGAEDFALYKDVLFLYAMPVNANNGEMIEEWQVRDEYNQVAYPFLTPIYDDNSGNLYAVGKYKLYCLEMPKL